MGIASAACHTGQLFFAILDEFCIIRLNPRIKTCNLWGHFIDKAPQVFIGEEKEVRMERLCPRTKEKTHCVSTVG
jgi:hypothetical protein